MDVAKYAKAIVGAVVAGAGSLQVALTDGTVTTEEWITVAVTTISALGLVWGVQNRPDGAVAEVTEDRGEDVDDTAATDDYEVDETGAPVETDTV